MIINRKNEDVQKHLITYFFARFLEYQHIIYKTDIFDGSEGQVRPAGPSLNDPLEWKVKDKPASQRSLNFRRLKNLQVWPDWLPLLREKVYKTIIFDGSEGQVRPTGLSGDDSRLIAP